MRFHYTLPFILALLSVFFSPQADTQASSHVTLTLTESHIVQGEGSPVGMYNPKPGVYFVAGAAEETPAVPYYTAPAGEAEMLRGSLSVADTTYMPEPLSNGAWQAVDVGASGASGQVTMFFEPHTITGSSERYTLADIDYVRWWTWKIQEGVDDWALSIYLESPYDEGTYAQLLGEPHWVDGDPSTPGQANGKWNSWLTHTASNPIVFRDVRYRGLTQGWATMPTLEQIVDAGLRFDWDTYDAPGGPHTRVDYARWEVAAVALAVDTEAAAASTSYLDALSMSFGDDNATITVDFEEQIGGLLNNGSFENAAKVWKLTHSGSDQGRLFTPKANVGDYAMVGQANGVTEYMQQTLGYSGTSGTNYRLTFSVAGMKLSNDGQFAAQVEFRNAGSKVNVVNCVIPNRGSFNWTERVCDFVAGGDHDTIIIRIGWRNITSGRGGIDPASFVQQ